MTIKRETKPPWAPRDLRAELRTARKMRRETALWLQLGGHEPGAVRAVVIIAEHLDTTIARLEKACAVLPTRTSKHDTQVNHR